MFSRNLTGDTSAEIDARSIAAATHATISSVCQRRDRTEAS
jgi:hypothetical protein